MSTPSEVLKLYATYSDGHQLEELLQLIDDDATYLFSNESAYEGKAAVREAIANNFSAIANGSYRLSDVRWLTHEGETAVCVYNYHWNGEISGEPMSGYGRGTSVLRSSGNSWIVVHEHLSRGRLPAQSDA